jgi:membrane carboxypeptidase/penicillin-binding protein
MKAATAGRGGPQFQPPEGITFIEIDKDTGKLATPHCPRTFTEAFISGTEPLEICPLHGF